MKYTVDQDINEEHLELAMEAAGLDLWEADLATGNVTRKATKLFTELGYSEDEVAPLMDDILMIVHPDDTSVFKAAFNDYMTGVTARYRCEFRIRTKSGAWVWHANYGKIIVRDEHRQGPRLIGVTLNIDDRKHKEFEQGAINRALKLLSKCSTILIHAENEQILLDAICKLAVESAGYLMAWVGFAENDETKSVSCRAQSGFAEGYLDKIKITWSDSESGQGPAGVSIKTRSTVANQDYQTNPKMAPWSEAAIQRGYGSSIALPLFAQNHVLGVFSIYSTEPFAFNDEEVALLEELASNISYGIEALRTHAENEESRAQLRGLMASREDAREEERKYIAREVHDELGQILTGLKLNVSVLEQKYAADSASLREHLRETMMLTDRSLQVARNVASALRPAALEMGIISALEWLAGRFESNTGIQCEINIDDTEIQFDENLAIALFRIVQESLTNVSRHAKAQKVIITIYKDADDYFLKVRDNGMGFDASSKKLNSFGLVGIRERALILGGTAVINSRPGNGTEIVVQIPAQSISEES